MEKNILGTDVIIQIGILVRDIDRAAQDYADLLNVPKPEIVSTQEYDKALTEYLGKPTKARAKQAFFRAGPNLDIELLEPDEEPSIWRHDLDTKGEGVHHVAFRIRGMKDKLASFEASGLPLIQKGEYPGGRYAYLDARETLKLTLELLEND